MPRPDVINATTGVQALADFAHLNRLDDLWTAYLREPGEVPPAQLDALDRITSEMDNLLRSTGKHAVQLRGLINQQRTTFDDAFTIILGATAFDPGRLDQLSQVVSARQGFANLAIEQLDIIQEQSQRERELLQEKMTHIRRNGITKGDLSFRFKCALGIAVLAAALAAMVYSGTILIPALAAAVKGGLGAAAIVNTFLANGGISFLADGTGAVKEVADLVEKGCFKRNP